MPLIFLVIFGAVFGNGWMSRCRAEGGGARSSTTSPAWARWASSRPRWSTSSSPSPRSATTACSSAAAPTPLPAWVLIAGRALSCVVIALATVAILVVVGIVAYGVDLQASAHPRADPRRRGRLGRVLLPRLRARPRRDSERGQRRARRAGDRAAAVLHLRRLRARRTRSRAGCSAWPTRSRSATSPRRWSPCCAPAGKLDLGHLAFVAAWGVVGLAIAVRRFRWVWRGRDVMRLISGPAACPTPYAFNGNCAGKGIKGEVAVTVNRSSHRAPREGVASLLLDLGRAKVLPTPPLSERGRGRS